MSFRPMSSHRWNDSTSAYVVGWRRRVVSVVRLIVARAGVVRVVRVVFVAFVVFIVCVGETTRALDAEGCLRDGAGWR